MMICASLYAIVHIQDQETEIAAYFADKYPGLQKVSEYFPQLVMAVAGNIMPEVTKFLIDFEEWDYPEDSTKQEILRNYISYMTNLVVFTILAYRGLYNIAFIDDIFGSSFASRETDDSRSICRYDIAGE